jgi:hypothetical protein
MENYNNYKEIAQVRKVQLEAAESKIQELANENNTLKSVFTWSMVVLVLALLIVGVINR